VIFPCPNFCLNDEIDDSEFSSNSPSLTFESLLEEKVEVADTLPQSPSSSYKEAEILIHVVLVCSTKHSSHDDESLNSSSVSKSNSNFTRKDSDPQDPLSTMMIPLTVFSNEVRITLNEKSLLSIPFFAKRVRGLEFDTTNESKSPLQLTLTKKMRITFPNHRLLHGFATALNEIAKSDQNAECAAHSINSTNVFEGESRRV